MKVFVTGILVFIWLFLLAGNFLAKHTIAEWPDHRRGAVSLGFDDSCKSHLTVAVPALNARGFKGTFFLITHDGSDPDWDSWRRVAAQGHEIASHSVSHADLPSLPHDKAIAEMVKAKKIIRSKIPFEKGITFAYPFGFSNPFVESHAEEIYIGSKDVLWGRKCPLNGGVFDFGDLVGCSYDDGHADVYAGVDAALAEGKWLDVSTHTVNGRADGCWGEWNAEDLTRFLDYLVGKDLYVGTFGSLVKYTRERLNASLHVVSSSGKRIVLRLADTLDDDIYDRPLTLRSEVPSAWLSAKVSQGGAAVEVRSVLESGTRVIYYDAVPDRGDIAIEPAPSSSGLAGIGGNL